MSDRKLILSVQTLPPPCGGGVWHDSFNKLGRPLVTSRPNFACILSE